jgi:hypothetical protein
MVIKKHLKWIGLILVVFGIVGFYHFFDPAKSNFFPRCPFKTFTGYDCPGCGSQQAVHYLLNFEFIAAMKANLLLILSIPVVLAFFIIDHLPHPSPTLVRWEKCFSQSKYIWIIVVVVMLFWIARNLITISS